MRDKGKAIDVSGSSSSNWFTDYCSSSSDLPCKKHPSSSSVGICALCLKDRLVKLVCSDCGEQRLSSCSCSDISSSYPNSCSVDIGSVGRISFLIENEKDDQTTNFNFKSKSERKSVATVLLKRSSSTSTSVDVKKGGFWKFGRLFRKKKDKDFQILEKDVGGVDEKCEMWGVEHKGVSRSRSLCSYRTGLDDSEGSFAVSTGRPSNLSKDGNTDLDKISGGFTSGKTEPGSDFRGFRKGSLFDFDGSFCGAEDSGFIDLKIGLFSELKPGADFLESESSSRVSSDRDLSGLDSQSFECSRTHGMFNNGSSCRITVNSNDKKKCKKSFKMWKWIVKHHSSSPVWPAWKKNEHQEFKS